MLAALALSIFAGIGSPRAANSYQADRPPQSIFERTGIKQTGKSGYEDYLAAVDVMWDPAVKQCTATAMSPPPGVTPLAAKRAWVAAARKALALVRSGNAKPILDPRSKITPNTLFPEFAGFRDVAKLFAAEARVRFADGDFGGATQSLVDALAFGDRIGHFILIGSLVGMACINLTLTEVEAELGVLSERDAVTLARAADALLDEPTPLVDGLASEANFWDSQLDLVFANLSQSVAQLGDSNDAASNADIVAQAGALSNSDKQALKGRVLGALHGWLDAALAILRGPEKGWTDDQPEEPTPDNLQDYLTQAVVPTIGPAMNRAAVARTQLRLLRLHGAVITFLWEHHRLPKDLAELGDKTLTDDPIVGESYHYQLTGERSYTLWSAGWKKTGRIELKYKSQGGADDGRKIP